LTVGLISGSMGIVTAPYSSALAGERPALLWRVFCFLGGDQLQMVTNYRPGLGPNSIESALVRESRPELRAESAEARTTTLWFRCRLHRPDGCDYHFARAARRVRKAATRYGARCARKFSCEGASPLALPEMFIARKLFRDFLARWRVLLSSGSRRVMP